MSVDLQIRFDYLCHKLLDVRGSRLVPKNGDRTTPTIALIRTDLGDIFIKRSQYGLHVSTPNYGGTYSVYHRELGADTAAVWVESDAASLVPMIEQQIALDLLADL